MTLLFMLIGAVLVFNGVLLLVYANITLGTILTLILGIFLFAIGIFYDKIKVVSQKGIWRAAKIAVIILLCAEFLLLGSLAIYGENDTVTYKEDAVIVLGAGVRGDRVTLPLKMRLDKAVEIHRKNPGALIVVSGGKGNVNQ